MAFCEELHSQNMGCTCNAPYEFYSSSATVLAVITQPSVTAGACFLQNGAALSSDYPVGMAMDFFPFVTLPPSKRNLKWIHE
jgi:hypothetical protein